MKKFVFLAAIALSVSACAPDIKIGPDGKVTQSSDERETSYRFQSNGCDTKKQVVKANSEDELEEKLCERLQDNSANHYCAESMRKTYFNDHCSGTWDPQ